MLNLAAGLGAVLVLVVLIVLAMGLPGLVRAILVRVRPLRRRVARRASRVRYRTLHVLALRPAGRQGRFGRHG